MSVDTMGVILFSYNFQADLQIDRRKSVDRTNLFLFHGDFS